MLVTLTNGYRHHLIKRLEIQKLDVKMLVTLTNGYRHILKFVIMFRSVKTFWNETHKIIIFSCLGWHWLYFNVFVTVLSLKYYTLEPIS